MEAFLLTRNLLTLLVCVPIHGVCALLCARDPRFFDSCCCGDARACRPAHHVAALEGEQLQRPGAGSAGYARPTARSGTCAGIATGDIRRWRVSAAGPLRRERSAAEHVPYSAHVSPTVVRTAAGDYLQGLRLGGASFESADDEQLNTWHERLNVAVAQPRDAQPCAVDALVRRPRARRSLRSPPGAGFADALSAALSRSGSPRELMVNELYLALVHRPAAGAAAGLVTRALSRSQNARARRQTCPTHSMPAQSSRRRCRRRSRATSRNCWALIATGNTWCSSLLEFLALLVNGECAARAAARRPADRRWPPRGCCSAPRPSSTALPAATRVGAMLGIKEYADPDRRWACTTACCRRHSRSC